MWKMTCRVLLASVFAVFGFGANGAGPQWCTGTVSNLIVNNAGIVFVYPSSRGDYVQICNINADVGGVPPTTCLIWFAVLKSAVQRQSSVIIQYGDAPACNALPTYTNAPIPFYVMQIN
jgi:hypothetical protein